MITLHWVDALWEIFDNDLKCIRKSRNMKKSSSNNQGHEIYIQNHI